MQVWPPVEVIRTVDAVTEPVVDAGPAAVTQSPTAKLDAAADWFWLNVVDDVSVTETLVALTLGGDFVLDFFEELLEGFGRLADEKPLNVSLVGEAAVTFPEANPKLAPPNRRPAPPAPP